MSPAKISSRVALEAAAHCWPLFLDSSNDIGWCFHGNNGMCCQQVCFRSSSDLYYSCLCRYHCIWKLRLVPSGSCSRDLRSASLFICETHTVPFLGSVDGSATSKWTSVRTICFGTLSFITHGLKVYFILWVRTS